jgi:predicted TPR repeat methyltransferase
MPALARADAALPSAASEEARAHARLSPWRRQFPVLDRLIAGGVAPGPALRRLGLTLWTEGQTRGAAEALAEAVAFAPADAAAWLDLGFARRACGDLREALDAFEVAAQLAPADGRARLAIGLVAKALGCLNRAEAAFEAALACDAGLDDARYSLGLIAFEARRYAEAAARWRPLVAKGYAAPGLWLGLGQCQFFAGEFAAAAQSLGAHIKSAPDDQEAWKRLRLVSFLDGAIRGGAQGARAAFAIVGGAEADVGAIARNAPPLLAAYGHTDAALALARENDAGSDPVHGYHLAALAGETAARAPAAYVAAYFDRFAESFDTQMFEVLQYRGPTQLLRLLDQTGASFARALDLGCGTGAAGPPLRLRAQNLVGVDLSGRMLAKAEARGAYDELVEADMVEHLGRSRAAYDLIFAADSLIYLGELDPLLEAAAGALRPGGLLAATLETTAKGAWVQLTSGRFAHSPRAVIAAGASHGLTLRAVRRSFLRLEAHRRVYGALIVLERPPAAHSGRVSAIKTSVRRRPEASR